MKKTEKNDWMSQPVGSVNPTEEMNQSLDQLKKGKLKVNLMGVPLTATELSSRSKIPTKNGSMDIELHVGAEGANGASGSFEICYWTKSGEDAGYEEGGLWFEGTTLVDYDGTFELHEAVIERLNDWGFDTTNI